MKKLLLLPLLTLLSCEAEKQEVCSCTYQKAYVAPNGTYNILETAPAPMYKCDDYNTWGWRPVNNSELKYRYYYECN